MTSRNYVMTSILMYFHQMSGTRRHLPTPPFDQFYCYNRPPQGGRSPAGLWSTVQRSASQDSNQFLVPCQAEGGGVAGSQLGQLSRFFKLDSWRHTILGKFPKPQRSVIQVSLDLGNARSKLTRPQYLTVLPDPGSIRAK
jgi:hypothetical protein